jgi:hypothetical protein
MQSQAIRPRAIGAQTRMSRVLFTRLLETTKVLEVTKPLEVTKFLRRRKAETVDNRICKIIARADQSIGHMPAVVSDRKSSP